MRNSFDVSWVAISWNVQSEHASPDIMCVTQDLSGNSRTDSICPLSITFSDFDVDLEGGMGLGEWVVSKWEHKVPSKFCQSVRHSWQRFAFIATLVRNCFSTFYSTKKPFYFAVKCSMYICTSQPPRPSPSVWNWRWRWYHSHNYTHPPNFSGSRATARTRSRPLNKRSAVCCEKKVVW